MIRDIIICYLIIISAASIITCIYDKLASKHFTKHRTREASLILLCVLGGSVAMLVTMLIIRHKTRHSKFMIGIPLIILLQLAVLLGVYLLLPY